MNFLEKLDYMMHKYNLNKSTLSKACGIPYTTIDGWYKKGYHELRLPTLKKLSAFFNTALDYWVLDEVTNEDSGKTDGFMVSYEEMQHIKKYRILDEHGKRIVDFVLDEEYTRCAAHAPPAPITVKEDPISYNVKTIPLRLSDYKVSAGCGAYLGPESFTIINVEDNPLTRRATFAVTVSGNSMEPIYQDGNILLVENKEELPPVGGIGIFTLGGEAFVKERGEGVLISLNSDYDPIPMDTSIRCNGIVIGVLEPEWME